MGLTHANASQQIVEQPLRSKLIESWLGRQPHQPDIAIVASLLEAFDGTAIIAQTGVQQPHPVSGDVPIFETAVPTRATILRPRVVVPLIA